LIARPRVPVGRLTGRSEPLAVEQKIYQRHCRVCHGADAKGRPGLEDVPAQSDLVCVVSHM
jgi:cytochrome c5